MLSLELIEKLRDSGFPIEQIAIDKDNQRHFSEIAGHKIAHNGDIILKAPILTELINVCGDELLGLSKVIGISAPGQGSAKCFTGDWQAVGQSITAFGKTPEEAMANLYIALYQKS